MIVIQLRDECKLLYTETRLFIHGRVTELLL